MPVFEPEALVLSLKNFFRDGSFFNCEFDISSSLARESNIAKRGSFFEPDVFVISLESKSEIDRSLPY